MSAAADELIWELSGLHRRLRAVVDGLDTERLDRVPASGANGIGVLVIHTLASESEWLNRANGRHIARDRESEFAARGRTAIDLAAAIDSADQAAPDLIRAAIAAGLETVRDRPGARPVTAAFCVVHAIAHTAEHVGHAEVARQVVTGTR